MDLAGLDATRISLLRLHGRHDARREHLRRDRADTFLLRLRDRPSSRITVNGSSVPIGEISA